MLQSPPVATLSSSLSHIPPVLPVVGSPISTQPSAGSVVQQYLPAPVVTKNSTSPPGAQITQVTRTLQPGLQVTIPPSPKQTLSTRTPQARSPLHSASMQVLPAPAPPVSPVYSQQCGGMNGTCTGPQLCIDAMWAGQTCQPGSYCRRNSPAQWVCTPVPSVKPLVAGQGRLVAAYQQCGGSMNCNANICQDGPWDGYTCDGTALCMRYSWQYWQCRSLPFPAAQLQV